MRPIRTLLAALAAGTLLIPLVGTSPAAAAPTRYVALGDSYASGEGLAPYQAGTDTADNRCHRSADRSYPRLLQWSTLPAYANLTSAACSGATTAALFLDVPDGSNEPPQLAALTPDTTLVTLTIGGNDAGFATVLGSCLYSPDSTVQRLLPGRSGCRKAADTPVRQRITALAGGAPQTGTVAIRDILIAIHTAAPKAKIVVSGYPKIFGSKSTDRYGCKVSPSLPVYVSSKDVSWFRHRAADLNDAVKTGVGQAKRLGVPASYVNVAKTFVGHNVCDRSPWVNGLVLQPTNPPAVSTASFHPNVVGQLAYAVTFAVAGAPVSTTAEASTGRLRLPR